jgi:RNA-directed DNA polymerase
MKDRAMQALYLLALEPVAETTADPNSYGFRPKRGCRDAIAQCFCSLSKSYSPRWILDADIKACFDWIDHDWLMENIPIEKKILRKWLKSGYIQKGTLYPTKAGTPQGGIISPLLANMTLDGMETLVKKHNKRGMKLNFIRCADDFIVTAEHRETLVDIIIPELKAFLKTRGLELSEEKTRIVNIEDGFDFLGQTLRKFKGNKLITQPSKESIRLHLDKVRSTIKYCGGESAEFLIKKLNPVIRGWSNYHRFVQSGKSYYYCQYLTNGYLMKWAKRNHGNKTPKWIRNHYWGKSRDKRHFSCLSMKDGKSFIWSLVYHPDVGLARYIKIRGSANPYSKDDREYFAMRDSCANLRRLESKRILPLVYSA